MYISPNKEKGNYIYPRFEFFVAASNRELISHLSDILKRHGYIGYADGSGKMHYVVDGSSGVYKSAGNIMNLISEAQTEFDKSATIKEYELQKRAIEFVLAKYSIARKLKGYAYLYSIIREMLLDKSDKTTPSKEIFANIAKQYETGRRQIDRVINYCFKKAGLLGINSSILANLVIEAKDEYSKLYIAEERSENNTIED